MVYEIEFVNRDAKMTNTGPRARSACLSQTWNFLSNHAHVLICLDRDPRSVMREVALKVGITERAVQKIVAELEAAGVVKRERQGRRNRYTIDPGVRLRHSLEEHRTVGDLLGMVNRPNPRGDINRPG